MGHNSSIHNNNNDWIGYNISCIYNFVLCSTTLYCRFTSDRDDAADMRHRMAIAGERSRRLDYLWRDNRLPRSLKLRLYAASVCSTLTHGSEAWILTPRALATLNGFNSRQLHRITVRSYREEATTPSYDLLTAVRTRRHQWLGHILRMPANRLVRRAVLALGQRAGPPYQPGSILMDAPFPLDELVLRAAEDGHATPDPSPPYRKAPKGYNSIDDDDDILQIILERSASYLCCVLNISQVAIQNAFDMKCINNNGNEKPTSFFQCYFLH